MTPRPALWHYAVVALAGAIAAYLLTPGVRVYSLKIGALDEPKDRSVHPSPTPTLGGIAIYVSFLVALAAAAAIPSLRTTFRFTPVFGLVLGGATALVHGIVDDRRELPAHVHAAADVLAAGILFLSGVKLDFFWLPRPIGVVSLSVELSAVVTIMWVWLLIQAVNFSDGLDGLAAGLSAIAAGAFFVYLRLLEGTFPLGPPLASLVAASIVGVCVGFLRHNFNPARIFMGDSGARVLGFLLAGSTISVMGTPVAREAEGGRLALPLVFTPIVFVALPIVDTLFAYARRVLRGKPWHVGDKEHIHHRLMNFGHSHRQAVVVMYLWALLLGGGLVVAGVLPWGRFLLVFAVAVGTLGLFTAAPRLRGGPGFGLDDAELGDPIRDTGAQRL